MAPSGCRNLACMSTLVGKMSGKAELVQRSADENDPFFANFSGELSDKGFLAAAADNLFA